MEQGGLEARLIYEALGEPSLDSLQKRHHAGLRCVDLRRWNSRIEHIDPRHDLGDDTVATDDNHSDPEWHGGDGGEASCPS